MMNSLCLTALSVFVMLTSVSALAMKIKEGQVILEKMEDYQFCQSKDYVGDWCHDALIRWVEDHPDDAFKAGKATRRSMISHMALPFFSKAFLAKKGSCLDEDVLLAVNAGLDLPMDGNSAFVKAAQEIGLKTCLSSLKDKIFQDASIGSYRLQNICGVPSAAAQLPDLKKAKCKK